MIQEMVNKVTLILPLGKNWKARHRDEDGLSVVAMPG
jgi:hypothetical protein